MTLDCVITRRARFNRVITTVWPKCRQTTEFELEWNGDWNSGDKHLKLSMGFRIKVEHGAPA